MPKYRALFPALAGAGAHRDAALGALLARRGAEQLDMALIAEIGTAAARERAVLNAMPIVASRNPAEARMLIDRYLTPPAQREQAQRIVDQMSALPAGFFPY